MRRIRKLASQLAFRCFMDFVTLKHFCRRSDGSSACSHELAEQYARLQKVVGVVPKLRRRVAGRSCTGKGVGFPRSLCAVDPVVAEDRAEEDAAGCSSTGLSDLANCPSGECRAMTGRSPSAPPAVAEAVQAVHRVASPLEAQLVAAFAAAGLHPNGRGP